MQLDDIVLTRCTSLLPFLKRIQFDHVSRRFASLSQAVDRTEKVSLMIIGKIEKFIDIDVDEEGQPFAFHSHRRKFSIVLSTVRQGQICQPAGCQNEQKIEKKLVAYECSGLPNMLSVLEPIFLRFKHYRTWKFIGDCGTILFQHLLDFFNNDQYIPAKVHGLSFCSQSTMLMPDRALIERLSQRLKELHLICVMPTKKDECESLWNAVATCESLEKFTFSPQNDNTLGYSSSKEPHSNQLMRQCLARLKIRQFTGEKLDGSFDDVWLNNCFKNNDNLRFLILKYVEQPHNSLAGFQNYVRVPDRLTGRLPSSLNTSNGFEIIGKLRRLKIEAGYPNEIREVTAVKKIHTILSALPQKGRLIVLMATTPFAFELQIYKEAIDVLKFWLKISNDTDRLVKLCLLLDDNLASKRISEAVKRQLSSAEDFPDLAIIKCMNNNRTILRQKNARLVFSIYDLANNVMNIW